MNQFFLRQIPKRLLHIRQFQQLQYSTTTKRGVIANADAANKTSSSSSSISNADDYLEHRLNALGRFESELSASNASRATSSSLSSSTASTSAITSTPTTTTIYADVELPGGEFVKFQSIREQFGEKLKDGEQTDIRVLVQGRIVARRDGGTSLTFFTMRDVNDDSGVELQFQLMRRVYELDDFDRLWAVLRRGDIVTCYGAVCKTPRGELTVLAHRLYWQSACLLPWQLKYEQRHLLYSKRYVDLLAHPHVVQRFKLRSQIISFIRRQLEDVYGFTEVCHDYNSHYLIDLGTLLIIVCVY
jgi:lysyl-tRNA synthetase class II